MVCEAESVSRASQDAQLTYVNLVRRLKANVTIWNKVQKTLKAWAQTPKVSL
jgi:hypothetical protein